jgi:magnesium transporter
MTPARTCASVSAMRELAAAAAAPPPGGQDAPVAGDGPLGPALSHATTSVPTAAPQERAGEVRERLTAQAFAWAGAVVLLDPDERLVGLVTLERLLAADAATPVAALVDATPPAVRGGADPEAAAWAMVRGDGSGLALVDAAGRFAGLVPPARLLGVLLAAHDEDLARLGGYLASTRRARSAAEEPVARRLWHRLPWLLLGLLGAMASATLVAAFEQQLDAHVLVAFFVPGIVYMADAVGTQTEAVLIRGLSVGVSLRHVVRRELITGAVVGIVMGAAFFAFALTVWGDGQVAAAVGIALTASCAIATVIAMTLPWAFQRVGADPAFGSGPLATVVQDLLSIAVYLLSASVLVP